MKRELKFRQPWFNLRDNRFSHFTYWGRLDHKNELSFDCFKSPGSSSHHYCKEDQQYTGLKDKNGKEIYEGDIVKHEFEGEYGPYEHRDTVEYHEGAFYPVCEKPGSEFEIIGDIYTTPELLKNE